MRTPDSKHPSADTDTPKGANGTTENEPAIDTPITADTHDTPEDWESISKDDLMQILEDESDDEGGEGHFDPGDKTSTLTK